MNLRDLLDTFAACDADAAEWRAWDGDDDGPEPACETLSESFMRYAHNNGFHADIWELTADKDEPWISYHRITRIEWKGRMYGVDWTARQFHNVPDLEEIIGFAQIPFPLVWAITINKIMYPLPGVRFGGPSRLLRLLDPSPVRRGRR